MSKDKDLKPGKPCMYYPIIKDGEKLKGMKTVITSEPWKLGHDIMVVKVAGVSGGVSVDHVELITE